MWQLTMYCHWRPPDTMPLLTYNVFRASNIKDLISIVTFTFTMRRHLIRLASASFISSHFATFGWVRVPCATCGKYNAEFTKGGWELWSYFKPFVDQSSRNLQTMQEAPCTFQRPFPIFCVTFRSEDIHHWVLKSSKMEQTLSFFGPQFFVGGTAPTFVQKFVRATYYPLLGKVWLSSVSWSLSAKPGNEAECRIYVGWVKMQVEFEAICGPKFMTFWDDVGDTL